MHAAPTAGNSGINQMWFKKYIYELSAVQAASYQPPAISYNKTLSS